MNNDFSKGKVSRSIIAQAVPLTLAQLIYLLYNVVDRIYIGHLKDIGSLALTGVGLTFPIITLILAFTYLFGTGGAPLFAIARGAKEEERARKLLGSTAALLIGCGILLMILCLLFRRPILYLFGASDASYVYADRYLKFYLLGTPFVMFSTGLNGFINAQGFPKVGMMTTVLGAVMNLILDPIFIFVFGMGVQGAAIATVISQMFSAIWVFRFLTGKKSFYRIAPKYMRPERKLTGEIVSLGLSGFILQGTNCLVQILCNATLSVYGGDLYVGIMTVLNSIRELFTLPVNGITDGCQPVLGFNYGAKAYHRVKEGIRFTAILGISYTMVAWVLILIFPAPLIRLFTSDAATLTKGVDALKVYFFGFCFMALQFCGQSVFRALGKAKQAIFFSIFRKVIIVAPLTLLLPRLGLGVYGVFWAEPISNLIGGVACMTTMYRTIYRRLK